MKQINLFLVLIILFLGLIPFLLPNRFDENIEYELDAPVGLVYDEFYNLRQFSKWERLTSSDSSTIKKFTNTNVDDRNSMIWDSDDASIASGKITVENFSINHFVNYTIKYDGWEKLDTLKVKFDQNENGKTLVRLNYLSQDIPYFYRYFTFFKGPKSKFLKSMDHLNELVKIRLDKDKKEGKLNYGEYRIVELGNTNLLAVRKQSHLAEKDVMSKIDAAFGTIYKALANKEGSFDFDLGFPYIYFVELDEKKDKAIFFAGIQLIEDLPLLREMKKITIPGGKYLLTLHLGPRSKRQKTIERMKNYANSKKIELDSKQLEVMLNDPKETDSLKLMSRIYIPLKRN